MIKAISLVALVVMVVDSIVNMRLVAFLPALLIIGVFWLYSVISVFLNSRQLAEERVNSMNTLIRGLKDGR